MIRRSSLPDRLLTILFVGALSSTWLVWAVRGLPGPRALPEERMSVAFPAKPVDLATATAWPGRFERWFEDALAGRETLLAARSRLLARGFGTSPTPNVYLGRDDWVFLSEARQLEVQRGVAPFRPNELDAWVVAIRARERWCAARGRLYVFALVPDKTDVYPERHAHRIERLGPTRFDQLARRLEGETAFLDLRPVMQRAKDVDRDGDHAYFPYGSPWTDRGARAGAEAILARIVARAAETSSGPASPTNHANDTHDPNDTQARAGPRFAALAPFADGDLVWEPRGIEGDSWAARLYLRGLLVQSERAIGAIRGRAPVVVEGRGDETPRNVTTLDDPALPRVLALHDSFGIPLVKFFAQRASRCVFLRGDSFRPEVIEAEAPDVVLEILCERVLAFPPAETLPEQRDASRGRFEAATDVSYRLDAARDVDVLASRPGVTARVEGAGVRVAWSKETALARLPDAFLRPDARVLARFDVDVEHAGELLVFYRTPEIRDYSRSGMISRALTAGSNRVYVDLDIAGVRGPILLRATSGAGAFVLRAVEARTVPR